MLDLRQGEYTYKYNNIAPIAYNAVTLLVQCVLDWVLVLFLANLNDIIDRNTKNSNCITLYSCCYIFYLHIQLGREIAAQRHSKIYLVVYHTQNIFTYDYRVYICMHLMVALFYCILLILDFARYFNSWSDNWCPSYLRIIVKHELEIVSTEFYPILSKNFHFFMLNRIWEYFYFTFVVCHVNVYARERKYICSFSKYCLFILSCTSFFSLFFFFFTSLTWNLATELALQNSKCGKCILNKTHHRYKCFIWYFSRTVGYIIFLRDFQIAPLNLKTNLSTYVSLNCIIMPSFIHIIISALLYIVGAKSGHQNIS